MDSLTSKDTKSAGDRSGNKKTKTDGKFGEKMEDFCYEQKTHLYQTTISNMNISLKISTVNFINRLPQEVRVFSADELQEFITQGAVIKKTNSIF